MVPFVVHLLVTFTSHPWKSVAVVVYIKRWHRTVTTAAAAAAVAVVHVVKRESLE